MYEVIDVTADAGQLEPMGSKPKFWFEATERGPCLFKAARPDSGEDWSEKVAERLAESLGLPHAEYELAMWKGERGIVTPRMTSPHEDLVHGNEILIELDRDYEDQSAGYRTPMHTVSAVLDAIHAQQIAPPDGYALPEGVETAIDVFIGYLALDALIGNTDRHHENWAAIRHVTQGGEEGGPLTLAPTFDHASCLGRNEPVGRMSERLTTNDGGFTVEAYAERARSALYSSATDAKPLTPLDAFLEAAQVSPSAARAWCHRIALIGPAQMDDLLGAVPPDRMPEIAKEFVARMVSHNRNLIEASCENL